MDEGAPDTTPTPKRRLWIPVAIVVLLALAGAGVWLYTRREPPRAPVQLAMVRIEPEAAHTAAPLVTVPSADDGPPLGAEGARAALEGASSHPVFRSWLGNEDLVRLWVLVTANLAAGESPRRALAFLAPLKPFTATARGDRLVISAESCKRYDYFADAVATVDPAAMARVYRRLHGTLETAHRALGLSAGSLDAATAKALNRIVTAPAPDEVEVRAREGVYELVDPRLEDLGDVEKHFLRMGPRNTRILQAKARALLDALRLPVVAAQQRP